MNKLYKLADDLDKKYKDLIQDTLSEGEAFSEKQEEMVKNKYLLEPKALLQIMQTSEDLSINVYKAILELQKHFKKINLKNHRYPNADASMVYSMVKEIETSLLYALRRAELLKKGI